MEYHQSHDTWKVSLLYFYNYKGWVLAFLSNCGHSSGLWIIHNLLDCVGGSLFDLGWVGENTDVISEHKFKSG